MRKTAWRWIGLLAALALVSVAIRGVEAGEFKYPEKGISLLVGYAAGGSTDLIARLLAEEMSKKWGTPVTVINKPGASGATALLEVKNAKADGHTVLMHINSGVTNPVFEPSLPYKWDELTYILRAATSPLVVIAKADGPYRTFNDLAAALKKDPGSVKLGLAGAYGAGLFTTIQLGQALGVDTTKTIRVVMAGGNQAAAAVAGGHVDYGIQYLSEVVDLIKGGKLRALGMVNASRVAALSDVPTMKELGFESVNWQPWAGIGGPAGIRKEVVEAWNKAAKELFADQKFLAKVENLGFTPAYLGPEEFKAFADRFHKTAVDVKSTLPK